MKHITTVTIPALEGKKVIADSKLFSYVDPDFKKWGADKPSGLSKKMKLDVQEMDKDATFAQMMSPEHVLTQEQILYFVEYHKDLLRQDGYETFFPFKSGTEVFVADVIVLGDGRLRAGAYRLSNDYVWNAEYRHRFVVPQLALNSSALCPSAL